MTRRSLLAGGVVTFVTGVLLLALGLGWGRGGEPAVGAAAVAVPTESVAASEADSSGLAAAGHEGLSTGGPDHAASPTTEPAEVSAGPRRGAVPDVLGRRRRATATTTPTAGVNLAVSAIGLDVPVRAGGASSSGVIVPGAGRAIWVRGYGRVRPGDVGTAVVAAHVVSSGRDDVFAELSSVRVGHTVVVTSGADTRTYVVTRTAVVPKAALTRDVDVWGQNTSQRRIVLITCDDGLGYRKDGHRVANYVVVADAT